MTRTIHLALALTFCLALEVQAALLREAISLNGEWDVQVVPALGLPVTDAWGTVTVPGTISGTDGRCAWFRTRFTIPTSMAGRRLLLHFGGVKYNSRVLVNGQHVGGHFGGYDPFDVDITAVAWVGEENELLVGCRDWTGIFSHPVDFAKAPADWDSLRAYPKDAILAPIGGIFSEFGPWDDVELRAQPFVYVDRVAITTSVRQRRIDVEYTLRNATPDAITVDLAARVEDPSGPQGLRAEGIRIRPGGSARVQAGAPWPNARLWSHEDPQLYHLVTELRRGNEDVDALRTRFGFREFWVDGAELYLNGSKVHLLASSAWPMHSLKDRDAVRDFWTRIRAGNNIAFRTHTQPWRRVFYDVADEVGILVIPEGAVWNDDESYRVNDPAFWENYAEHLRAMVEQYRNHPSVVMYSLENEMYGARQNERNVFATEQLAELGRRVKRWDPTRPITYESDGDPLGVADVVGIHYPHEYPDFTQYPNTGWWLEDGTRGVGQYGGKTDGLWRWDRLKPLYIGEFLWVPSPDPSWDTVFVGDQAYSDPPRYHNLAKAQAWSMQIEAYRDQGVNGICPWTLVEGGALDDTNPLYVAQRQAFRPIAAFPREYNARFYADDEVERNLTVYNDILSPSTLVLTWELLLDGQRAASGHERLNMAPGERMHTRIRFRVPRVAVRTPLELVLKIHRDGELRFEEHHPGTAWPRGGIAVPRGSRVVVYDPAGGLDGVIGPDVPRIASLQSVPAPPAVLVVGAEAFPPPPQGRQRLGVLSNRDQAMVEFVRQGGRVIVLHQRAYPSWIGTGRLTSHASTMTFAQMPDHPALRGITDRDLKWWASPPGAPADHLVTGQECARPESGAFRAIVVSGSASGIAHAPLLELPCGQGTVLLCQMLVQEKSAFEPVAAQLLTNLLDYAANYSPAPRQAVLVAGSDEAAAALTDAGLRYTDQRLSRPPAGLERPGLAIADGPTADGAALHALAASGGTVVLHCPAPELLAQTAGDALGPWSFRPASGPLARVSEGHLAQHLAREDLYWLGPHVGASYSQAPPAPNIIDQALVPTSRGRNLNAIEAETLPVSGPIVQLIENGSAVGMFTNGDLTAEIDFGPGGPLLIGGRLGGTPAGGTWPQCRISVDGAAAVQISTAGQAYDDYVALMCVPGGTHRVTLSFVNDGSSGTEDRNLFVDKVLWGACELGDASMEAITEPAGVAVIPVGAGRVVLDCVRWDAPGSNRVRAQRYLCGLLTALDADMEARADAESVQLSGLTVDPGVAYGGTDGGTLHFGSSGAASGEIEVVRAGRYALEITGWGTPAAGEFPIVEILLDDRLLGRVAVASTRLSSHTLGEAELPGGIHRLVVRFVNDLYSPPEDRNVWLDALKAYPAR